MGKKKTKNTDEAVEGEEVEGGSKLKLIIGAVVLVVIGAVLGGKVLGGGAEPAEAAGPTTTTTEPPGPVTTLDAITLNLADGRFLKLGLAIEIHADAEYPVATEVPDEIAKGFSREVDATISLMSSYTYEDLVGPDGKRDAKRRLLEELDRVSDGAVKDVLFHQFVMQ